ncbi:MAG: hypothetical protein CTY25_06010 [Methylobacterium sp.]|nr:MAG: hypothetical protein CTY25_06010 [Methylobacterium sp.]
MNARKGSLMMGGAVVVVSSLAAGAQTTTDLPTPPRRAEAPAASAISQDDCLERLKRGGIVIEAAGASSQSNAACEIASPVTLVSVVDSKISGLSIAFSDRPRVSCAMAEKFAYFSRDIVAPLARGIFDRDLVAISTGPGHECRPRNRQSGAKLSSHGQGNALDVSAMELSGRFKITIENPGNPAAERLIAGIRAAACGVFNTVLGPGSDAAHRDHIHLDIEVRGRDGRSKLCQ